jgi:serine/alanine adding enzyme
MTTEIRYMSDITITVTQSCSTKEWDEYVSSHPVSTIYHSPEWSQILEDSLGYKPFHLFARNGDGKLCGVLPLVMVKSLLTGNHLVSLPFSYVCGAITDSPEALSYLIKEAKILCDSIKCSHIEIRVGNNEDPSIDKSPWMQNSFEVSRQFSTYILGLSSPDVVWKKLDSKSVRWAVGKARKDGVQVRKGNSIQDIRTFYNLNLKTKRRIGVPGHPERLFLSMFDKLNDRCTLYLASLRQETIAGIITMKSNDTVIYGYGASDDNFRVNQPNSLLVWTAIEEACTNGYKYFDFGRTSPAEKNVTSFKKHWGTEEKILSYYYHPHIPNSIALNETGATYRMASGLWKKMPLPLARYCSDKLFYHLG